jgi:probable phosphoglycerate mutase
MRLLLVRHGESEWNAEGRWQGQADPPLSDIGRRQAQVAADGLGSVDAVVASPLVRAHDTAVIISESLGIGPVVVLADLQERHAGEWQGLTHAEIEDAYPGYLADRRRPPGFEPDEALLTRALAVLDRIAAEFEGADDVLVVTHGGLIYTLERHLGEPFERIPNLGARWFGLTDGRLSVGERLLLVDPDQVAVTNPGQI